MISEDNSCTINMISPEIHDDMNYITNLPTSAISASSSLMTNNIAGASTGVPSPSPTFETCTTTMNDKAAGNLVNSHGSGGTTTLQLQPTQIVLEGNNKVSVVKVGDGSEL